MARISTTYNMAKRRTLKRRINELTATIKELQEVNDNLRNSYRIVADKVARTAEMEKALHLFANENSIEGLRIYQRLFPNVMGQMM